MNAVRHPPDVVFLEECQPLAVDARAMLAALVLERWCAEHDLTSAAIDAFLDHHWSWLDVSVQQLEFSEWERNHSMSSWDGPSGDPSEIRLGTLLEQVAETLLASLYTVAQDERTFAALRAVVDGAQVSRLPPVTPLKFSLFRDRDGWGNRLTPADRDYWRSLRSTYARAAL